MFRTKKRWLLLAAGVQTLGGVLLGTLGRHDEWGFWGSSVGFVLIATPLFLLFFAEAPKNRDEFGIGIVRLGVLGWMTAGATLVGVILPQLLMS
jgi:hypothetical protein